MLVFFFVRLCRGLPPGFFLEFNLRMDIAGSVKRFGTVVECTTPKFQGTVRCGWEEKSTRVLSLRKKYLAAMKQQHKTSTNLSPRF